MIETNEILRICLRRIADLCANGGAPDGEAACAAGELATVALAAMEGEAVPAGKEQRWPNAEEFHPTLSLTVEDRLGNKAVRSYVATSGWIPLDASVAGGEAFIPRHVTRVQVAEPRDPVKDPIGSGTWEWRPEPTAQTAHPTAHDARSNARSPEKPQRWYGVLRCTKGVNDAYIAGLEGFGGRGFPGDLETLQDGYAVRLTAKWFIGPGAALQEAIAERDKDATAVVMGVICLPEGATP